MSSSEIWNNGFINLSLIYAREYKKNGKVFIGSFLKFGSVRSACYEIVRVYRSSGALEECRKCGKDFSGWVGKLNLEEKWKGVLADVLLIVYNLKN